MITDQAAVQFSNEHARRVGDQLGRAYYMAKEMLAKWDDVSNLFAVDEAATVDDGSSLDGRNPITAGDIMTLAALAQQMVDEYEANQSAVLRSILKVAVNPE